MSWIHIDEGDKKSSVGIGNREQDTQRVQQSKKNKTYWWVGLGNFYDILKVSFHPFFDSVIEGFDALYIALMANSILRM